MRPSRLRYKYARNALVLSVLGVLALSGGILCLLLKSYEIALVFLVISLAFFRFAKNFLNALRVTKIVRAVERDLYKKYDGTWRQ